VLAICRCDPCVDEDDRAALRAIRRYPSVDDAKGDRNWRGMILRASWYSTATRVLWCAGQKRGTDGGNDRTRTDRAGREDGRL